MTDILPGSNFRLAGSLPVFTYGTLNPPSLTQSLEAFSRPFTPGIPTSSTGAIDLPRAAEDFGNYWRSSRPKPGGDEDGKKPPSDGETKEGGDPGSGDTTRGTDDTTGGRDPRGTIGTEPDITPAETQNWVQDILNKFPEWRQAELDAEMRRYVLTGALRQQGLRELSRRKIEQENIAAWREVEKQRLASQSAQAIALANTAYLAQIPNTGVMEAMNNAMKAGISAGGLLSNTITPSTATYFS